MHLPVVSTPALGAMPPLYAWPRPIKRALLTLAIMSVVLAYTLLAGGIITLVLALVGWVGG